MDHGYIIVLDKPPNISSNAASIKCRRILQHKKSGYIGTLDPLATGVLPVFTGKMTKLIPYFESAYKTYDAVFELGKCSPSLDTETEVTSVDFPDTDEIKIKAVIQEFIGTQMQTPPAYSAIKTGSIRSYKLAIKNIPTDLPPRQVQIFDITNISIKLPFIGFTAKVSKGTYIRVLVDDIARKMNTRAVLTKLRRTAHGDYFNVNQAKTLAEIENAGQNEKSGLLFNTVQYIIKSFVSFTANADNIQNISNGKTVPINNPEPFPVHTFKNEKLEPVFAISADNTPVAAGYLEYSRDMHLLFHPHKVLL